MVIMHSPPHEQPYCTSKIFFSFRKLNYIQKNKLNIKSKFDCRFKEGNDKNVSKNKLRNTKSILTSDSGYKCDCKNFLTIYIKEKEQHKDALGLAQSRKRERKAKAFVSDRTIRQLLYLVFFILRRWLGQSYVLSSTILINSIQLKTKAEHLEFGFIVPQYLVKSRP